MTIRGWTAGSALLALVAAVAPASLAAPAPGAPSARPEVERTVKVVYQNIAGGSRAHGDPAALTNVYEQMASYQPDIVMVVEICRSTVDDFRRAQPGWRTHFTALRADLATGCADAADSNDPVQGELLAAPYPMSNVTRTKLSDGTPEDELRTFHLTCAEVGVNPANPQSLRACVTHLRAGTEDDVPRQLQVREIQSALEPFIAYGQRVVVAGDFNTRPWSSTLNRMYATTRTGAPGGLGDFVESDQTDRDWFALSPYCTEASDTCRSGAFTLGEDRRYDYIFFSAPGTSDLHGWAGAYGVGDVPPSDHRLVRGRATLLLR